MGRREGGKKNIIYHLNQHYEHGVGIYLLGEAEKCSKVENLKATGNHRFYSIVLGHHFLKIELPSVQSFSSVWLFVTPWTAARQASLSITNSQSWLRLMSFKLVMPSDQLELPYDPASPLLGISPNEMKTLTQKIHAPPHSLQHY